MNILFVTNKNVYPLIGGIERITYVLAQAFSQLYGWKCHSLYTQENNLHKTTDDAFISKYLLSGSNSLDEVITIIDRCDIQVIIAQGADSRVNEIMPLLRQACDNSKQHPSLLFVYHNMPGFELVGMDVKTLFHRLLTGHNKSAALRQIVLQCVYKMIPEIVKSTIAPKYKLAYAAADKMIMLSGGFIGQYDQFVHGDLALYCAIPNMLSYKISEGVLQYKKKTILVVARMDERQKRIKHALRIWRQIPHDGWQMKIVGDGEDLSYYQQLAKKWKMQDISFDGQQDPLRYYQEASIFMMTSSFEGWPMTLMEAIPCGCVPIAFDSYSAVHDIIDSGRNGIIVPEGDIDEYARQLQALMNNPQELQRMSENARMDCMRYSRENIAKQWKTLLENL